jgi:hypothetical protein
MKLYKIVRDFRRGNGLVDTLCVTGAGTTFEYGVPHDDRLNGHNVLLLTKNGAEVLADLIGKCTAVPQGAATSQMKDLITKKRGRP